MFNVKKKIERTATTVGVKTKAPLGVKQKERLNKRIKAPKGRAFARKQQMRKPVNKKLEKILADLRLRSESALLSDSSNPSKAYHPMKAAVADGDKEA